MPSNKMITAGSSLVAAVGLVVTGAALANASSSTPTSTLTGGVSSFAQADELRGADGGGTAVTGSELAKVNAAVKAKDSAVSVTSVRKDADGSYEVLGTKAGSPVAFDVSKDLKTITTKGRPGDGRGFGDHGNSGGSTPAPSSTSPSGTASDSAFSA